MTVATDLRLGAHGHSVAMLLDDPDDLVQKRILAHRDFYERPLLEDAYHRAGAGDVIDVGAHLGNHTLWFAGIMRRRVTAIEPYPDSAARLRRNIDANGLDDRVEVIQAAAGAALGYVERFDGIDARNTGLVRAVTAPGVRQDAMLCITLDSLRGSGFALIKVDVEGAALAVLEGAKATLGRDRPLLYIEAATLPERRELDRFLRRWGYRRFGQFCSTPTYGYAC